MDIDFKDAKTIVYWDVEDFPNTSDRSIDEIIKSALVKEGYVGEVSIKAYGEKKPDNLNVDGELITFTTKSGKKERLAKMSFDICVSAMYFLGKRNIERANVFVIAKDDLNEDRLFIDELDYVLDQKNMNVVGIVEATGGRPEETPVLWRSCKYWKWESLLALSCPKEEPKLGDKAPDAVPPVPIQ